MIEQNNINQDYKNSNGQILFLNKIRNKNFQKCRLSTKMGFPRGSEFKASACNAGDLGSNPGLRRSPGGGQGNPLQYSAWRIPWTEEPDGLQSMGSHRVGHDEVT